MGATLARPAGSLCPGHGPWLSFRSAGATLARGRLALCAAGHAARWFLVTSEVIPPHAVAFYRQRMLIEQEFWDLKGPLGLDQLATWQERPRVARLLAWIAVYKWHLAYLWLVHRLAGFTPRLRVAGALS